MELLSENLWLHIRREARISNRMRAAIAYVTDLSGLSPRRGDLLVVNASDKALGSGATDPRVLRPYLDASVELYSVDDLHAKAIAFERAAFVGSMNASEASRNRLVECALLTREPSVIAETDQFVRGLAEKGKAIDVEFLVRASEIYVPPVQDVRRLEFDTAQRKLWYLEMCPYTSRVNLRAYFTALIVTQLGDLIAGRSFALWPNVQNMSQHLKTGRLEKCGTRFQLTASGVTYFSSDDQWPDPKRLDQFLCAVNTGDEASLPDDLGVTSMKEFYV